MITLEKYINIVETVLNRNIEENLNQKNSILADPDENQYIVAGPGSGKTTVLVLKILKYIFVDDIQPEHILVTTFTKKAANELKNRTVKWANDIIEYLSLNKQINIENIIIGTLDSIAEEFLSEISPIEIIDDLASSAIMMQVLLTDERDRDKRLKQFVKKMKNNQGGSSASDLNSFIHNFRERIYYDMVDYNRLTSNATREKIVFEIIDDYDNQLKERNILDYVMLERHFYNYLSKNEIMRLKNIQILLIDEYQDTNYLQEQIYFSIARGVLKNGGSISVVGDDDQSLYRFRGASIELFTHYTSRIKKQLNITPKTIFLQKNYRSTSNIIDFTNDFILLDDDYQKSRTSNKPSIVASKNTIRGCPIFGIFRNNLEELSTDLSEFIYKLKIKKEYDVTRNNKEYNIEFENNPSIALLTNSPREITAYNRKRLPFYIRESISYKDEDLTVFNPRGQNIETTELVSIICGLILLSVDSDEEYPDKLDNIPPHTSKTLRLWRKNAVEYISDNDFVISEVSNQVNLIELLEDITNHLDEKIHETSENMIYYEIIEDTIKQTSNAIGMEGFLLKQQVLSHILVPIATGAINIDDDMFDFDLEENVNVMSIHQSKGLEFDVVIVDVGSDIFNNQSSSSFKRFPKNGGFSYNIEQYLKAYSPMNKMSHGISGVDEAFNDLIRRYFVAYSRTKSVLVLTGLTSMKDGYKGDFQNNIYIQNIATGWSRDKVWHWENLSNIIHI